MGLGNTLRAKLRLQRKLDRMSVEVVRDMTEPKAHLAVIVRRGAQLGRLIEVLSEVVESLLGRGDQLADPLLISVIDWGVAS